MTYLKGGRLYGQYRETVAPPGTAPGYWPHSVYCHKVGVESRGLTFVKPTMKLSDLYTVHTTTYQHYCVVNKDLSFKAKNLSFKAKAKAKDLTSEHVQGPL